MNLSYSPPIIFEFVVDTSGQVGPQTFHVVSTPDQTLSAAIGQMLRDSPYRSAERNGHKVRQLVRDTIYMVRH